MSYSVPNYNGRQPNNTAYIKTFVPGTPANLWKTIEYNKKSVITPSSIFYPNLYITGDLFVDGSIINPSDINIKKNITKIDEEISDKLMDLKPSSFIFKDDPKNKTHFGFIAQELEELYPSLIENKPDTKYSNLKAINYLEIIPLLVNKIQKMQKEIDELKEKIN